VSFHLHCSVTHHLIVVASSPSTVQIVLSTAHPAKFSEAVTKALGSESAFNFERDVLPEEFRGLLEREKRVIDVEGPDVDLVKRVIESKVGSAEAGGASTGSV
jgi:threonine synthase